MFRNKKYTIIFEKSRHYTDRNNYKVVTDATITEVIKDLAKKYHFRVYTVEIMDSYHKSYFTFYCETGDMLEIYNDFCNELSQDIENTKYKKGKY